MAVIGGKLFRNKPKNMNHVHKDTRYLFHVIITLGKYITGGDTTLYDGVKKSELSSIYHVLKNLHGIMIFVPLKKKSRKYSLKRTQSSNILHAHKIISPQFYHHGGEFYN